MDLRKIARQADNGDNKNTADKNPNAGSFSHLPVAPYNIGLDLGTNSVGWAVTDADGKLLHFKGKPTWGSRLWGDALTAKETRTHRSQRRRYIRRRWRLNLLQEIFQDEVEKQDKEFFIRMQQSFLLRNDPQHKTLLHDVPLFKNKAEEREFYKQFPTMYHLRSYLMEDQGSAPDIRWIYLACHHIVKYRGNFLRQGEPISSNTASPKKAFEKLQECMEQWCEARGLIVSFPEDFAEKSTAVLGAKQTASSKKDALAALIGEMQRDSESSLGENNKLDSKKVTKCIAGAIVGLKPNWADLFGVDMFAEAKDTSFTFDDEEKFGKLQEKLTDENALLFESIFEVYQAGVLQEVLSYKPGEYLSHNMVAKYDKYKDDLKLLKELAREYVKPQKYKRFFSGELQDGSHNDPEDTDGAYTKYNLGKGKGTDDYYITFKKNVIEFFKDTKASDDPRYLNMKEQLDNRTFLPKQRVRDNGAIYYQLHLEELQKIIDAQAKYYPLLKDNKDKICSLVTFRIPYYVGPLTSFNAAKDKHGNNRFAWSARKEGMEYAPVKPWNWEEVIDKNKSAENFMKRLIGTCTYLQGEPVLPKCSLLYEEFCVLNELNGSRYITKGDANSHRFDAAQREGIMNDLFKKRKSVTYKAVADWLEREEGLVGVEVRGGQGETSYVSKLSSYQFFCNEVFGVESLDKVKLPENISGSINDVVEDIILWNSLFEDRDILKEKIKDAYGFLTDDQIKKICKKRFTGWGNLSKKLLKGLCITKDLGIREKNRVSILDVLRDGNPATKKSDTMIFQEIVTDKDLGFNTLIDDYNRNYFAKNQKSLAVNDLPGSPALRRSINQALAIVDEIVGIAGAAPQHIYIETTRDSDGSQKGIVTKKRYDTIKKAVDAALKEFKDEFNLDSALKSELEGKQFNNIDERLYLYFVQLGKCMYSGQPLELSKLNTYEVDHILPRSYVVDDSLENKALVLRDENQRKANAYPLSKEIRNDQKDFWKALFDKKLIGEKKYKNLMRDKVDDKALKGFVARQLVETSQIVKLVRNILEAKYSWQDDEGKTCGTAIRSIKAGVSHELRARLDLPKNRDINDFHHAHDAYLACRIGLFVDFRHSKYYENPIAYTSVIRNFIKNEIAHGLVDEDAKKEANKRKYILPGASGFLVDSFCTSGFDKDTGEVFKDTWDADAEAEVITKAFDCKQVYISRMLEEKSGEFWDATVYPVPQEKVKDQKGPRMVTPDVPLKQGLDPLKYGGYNSAKSAYSTVAEAISKGSHVLRFIPVPIVVSNQIKHGSTTLQEYITNKLAEKNETFVQIYREKIYQEQLLIIGREVYRLGGKTNDYNVIKNGTQIALSLDEMRSINPMYNDLSLVSEDEIKRLSDGYNAILNRIVLQNPTKNELYSKAINLSNVAIQFMNLEIRDKIKLMSNLFKYINGNAQEIDLKIVKGKKRAGKMKKNINTIINESDQNVYVIDQSVTGMFERKQLLKLTDSHKE